MDNKKLPIGYWIKQVDQLLTDGIDTIQARFGMTRSHWQIINLLSEEPLIKKQRLLETMRPFMDQAAAEQALAELSYKGLVAVLGDDVSLTDTGKKQHTECFEQQKECRQSVMKDITPDAYQTTIQTLQKIVENLKA
jgi:DNA-binding MarR family transcriptional regulator